MERESISLGNYIKDKAEGVAKIVKVNGIPTYCFSEFTRTGERVAVNTPLVKAAVQQLEQRALKALADKQAELEAVRAVLADIDAAQEVLA